MATKTKKKPARKDIELIEKMKEVLPPVIARKHVIKFLGGMVAPKTLANADMAGEGPKNAHRVGGTVVYPTDSLLDWIVIRFGVAPVVEREKHQKGVKT